MRRREWGLSGRLIVSYILVTLAVVVLVEALVIGIQAPHLVEFAQQQALLGRVSATAQSYGQQLTRRYQAGLPAETVLGDPGQPARPGQLPSLGQAKGPPSALIVPAITGPVHSDQAIIAVVAVATDGRVVTSSAPSRYPPGQAAAGELPAGAV